MNGTRPTLTAKMQPVDWENLEICKKYYGEERCLSLKDSAVFKMLAADKAAELKKKKEMKS